jgi:hypothetical protein
MLDTFSCLSHICYTLCMLRRSERLLPSRFRVFVISLTDILLFFSESAITTVWENRKMLLLKRTNEACLSYLVEKGAH